MISKIRRIGLKCAIYKMFGRLFPKDNNVISACDRIGTYRYLSKYRYVLDNLSIDYNYNNEKPDIIWLCWLQGYENAPLIVRKCKETVCEHNPNSRIIIIDNSNVDDYVSIPQHIKDKHDKGIIPHAHYSDFIRISLLAKYGGTWIDSTFYATDKVPDYITKSDLFFFQTEYVGKVYGGCSLLSATKNNPIIIQQKALLSEYWKQENRLVSYSIFHLFWTMVINNNKDNMNCWERIPFIPTLNNTLLQMELFKPFSMDRFEQIKALTPLHKLTYKFPEESTQLENTFYKFIIQ